MLCSSTRGTRSSTAALYLETKQRISTWNRLSCRWWIRLGPRCNSKLAQTSACPSEGNPERRRKCKCTQLRWAISSERDRLWRWLKSFFLGKRPIQTYRSTFWFSLCSREGTSWCTGCRTVAGIVATLASPRFAWAWSMTRWAGRQPVGAWHQCLEE